ERMVGVELGQFNTRRRALKGDGVGQAVTLGGIKKTDVFTTVRPDLRALAVASRLKQLKDDAILREVATELESEGIQIRESTFGLRGILVEEGSLTKSAPSKKEWEDIRYGWEVAHEIGRLDIGQCVVGKRRSGGPVQA